MTRAERYLCTISRDADGRITAVEVAVHDLDGNHRHARVNGNRAPHIAGPLQVVLRSGRSGRQWSSQAAGGPTVSEPTLNCSSARSSHCGASTV